MIKTILIIVVLSIIISMTLAEAYDKTSCRDGFVLVKKTNTGKHACFLENHAKIIEFRGWGFMKTSYEEPSKIIFTMIAMPQDKAEFIRNNWTEDDFISSERVDVLGLFQEKTRALVVTRHDFLNETIQKAQDDDIKYIIYNNEEFNGPSSTPKTEVEQGPYFMELISDEVHDAGLEFISAPSWRIMMDVVDDVDWNKVNAQIIGFQLQKAKSTQQMIDEFNEKASIIRPQSPDSIFMLQVNPEWQTIDDVKQVLANTNGEVGGISVVCNFDSCTEQYLDELFGIRDNVNLEEFNRTDSNGQTDAIEANTVIDDDNRPSDPPTVQKEMVPHDDLEPTDFVLGLFDVQPEHKDLAKDFLRPNDIVADFNPNDLNDLDGRKGVGSFNGDSIVNLSNNLDNKIIEFIAYDPEPFATQMDELLSWGEKSNDLADIVHERGFKFGITPAFTTLTDDRTKSQFDVIDWDNVELLVIQTQILGKNQGPQAVIDFMKDIGMKVKSENPDIILLMQVNASFQSPQQVKEQIDGLEGIIDGVTVLCFPNNKRAPCSEEEFRGMLEIMR